MVVWTQEPIEVTVSEATTRANFRQWSALARRDEPEDYALPFREAEDERAASEPKLCKCDGCGAACDLNDDGTVVDERSDELLCAACVVAPYLAEDR